MLIKLYSSQNLLFFTKFLYMYVYNNYVKNLIILVLRIFEIPEEMKITLFVAFRRSHIQYVDTKFLTLKYTKFKLILLEFFTKIVRTVSNGTH